MKCLVSILIISGCITATTARQDDNNFNITLEQGQIGVFADVLMAQDPNMTLAVITIPLPPFSAEHVRIKGWMEAMRKASNRGVPFRLDKVQSSFPANLADHIYYSNPIQTYGSDDPISPMPIDSEWLAVLRPLNSMEWKVVSEYLGTYNTNMPSLATYENLFNTYRGGYGMICVKQADPPMYKPSRPYQVHPYEVVSEVRRIYEAMSSGGDTNALLALERELDVDFSRKLVQEIVRRKQPPPPPTQEEIWRERIDELWRFRWEGERINTSKEVHEHFRELERQFRFAHEAGELSDVIYLELMNRIGLDLIKDPKRTRLPRPPHTPSSTPENP
jgi:hypothetical protein